MTRFRCVVAVSPDVFAEANERFAGVRWARENVDEELGLIDLSGEFEDDEVAVSQLLKAVPELEAEGEAPKVKVFELAASDTLGVLALQQALRQAGLNLGTGVGDGSMGAVLAPEPSSTDQPPASEEPPDEKPEKAETAAPLAQTIDAGLKAIRVPTEVWRTVSLQDRREFASELIRDLHKERSAYARNIRWTFAPDAELLNQTAEGSARAELAGNVLKARVGLAEHQVALANQDVALRKESVAFAGEGVALRKEAVKQQAEVTKMLAEFVTQLKKWTSLANWGLGFLIVTTLFGMAMTLWVIKLARDDKITDWAVPTAIFALALFAISPAVLLLRERPLKGLDEAGWPGAGPSATAQETSAAAGAPAATPPASQQTSGAQGQPTATSPTGVSPGSAQQSQ